MGCLWAWVPGGARAWGRRKLVSELETRAGPDPAAIVLAFAGKDGGEFV